MNRRRRSRIAQQGVCFGSVDVRAHLLAAIFLFAKKKNIKSSVNAKKKLRYIFHNDSSEREREREITDDSRELEEEEFYAFISDGAGSALNCETSSEEREREVNSSKTRVKWKRTSEKKLRKKRDNNTKQQASKKLPNYSCRFYFNLHFFSTRLLQRALSLSSYIYEW